MNIHRIIVHNLLKEPQKTGARTEHSERLLAVDPRSTALIQRLDENYVRRNVNYAVFDDAPGKTFRDEFQQYMGRKGDPEFIRFTRNAVDALRDQIARVPLAKGGYLVFSEYADAGREYLGVYVIRNTTGMIFRRDEAAHTFEIDPAAHLDFERLAMACRIELQKYAEDAGRYLELINTYTQDIAEYFVAWIAAVQRESSRTFTQTLVELTADIELPKEDGREIPRVELQRRVYDYARSAEGRVVNLRSLSRHLYGDAARIETFLEQNQVSIDTEFKADTSVLGALVRVEVDAAGILMRFTRDKFGPVIKLDERNDAVVIIESREFRAELERARRSAFGKN